MTSTDPIADMLSRIRNAIAVNKTDLTLPYSKIKESVAKILKDSNFLYDISSSTADSIKTLHIVINPDGANAKITEIKRLSKPGRRLYVPADKIPTVKGGRGVVIVSTSKGLMTGVQAKSSKIGGELICEVY